MDRTIFQTIMEGVVPPQPTNDPDRTITIRFINRHYDIPWSAAMQIHRIALILAKTPEVDEIMIHELDLHGAFGIGVLEPLVPKVAPAQFRSDPKKRGLHGDDNVMDEFAKWWLSILFNGVATKPNPSDSAGSYAGSIDIIQMKRHGKMLTEQPYTFIHKRDRVSVTSDVVVVQTLLLCTTWYDEYSESFHDGEFLLECAVLSKQYPYLIDRSYNAAQNEDCFIHYHFAWGTQQLMYGFKVTKMKAGAEGTQSKIQKKT